MGKNSSIAYLYVIRAVTVGFVYRPNSFVAVPSILQIGAKQPVVVSVYKVNTPISVTLQVEDKWGNLLYQTPKKDAYGKWSFGAING